MTEAISESSCEYKVCNSARLSGHYDLKAELAVGIRGIIWQSKQQLPITEQWLLERCGCPFAFQGHTPEVGFTVAPCHRWHIETKRITCSHTQWLKAGIWIGSQVHRRPKLYPTPVCHRPSCKSESRAESGKFQWPGCPPGQWNWEFLRSRT